LGGRLPLQYSRPVGFRRGIVAVAIVTEAIVLCGCTANPSHPTQLSSAPASQSVLPSGRTSTSPAASVPAPSLTPSVAVSPTTASSPTTAGTSTSPAPSLPAALSSNDIAAGVRATAQEFFDDLNIAFATGDVTKIEALTSPACGCRSLVNTIKATYAQKQRIVGVSTIVKSLQVVSFIAGGATADMHYSISAGQIVDSDGHQVNTSISDPDEHSAMFIVRTRGTWIVQQNTLLNGPTK
jgi:Family of unknown function (DUF6318)